MSDDLFFDPRGIKRSGSNEPIPAGQYIAVIDKVNRKDGENITGLKIYFKVINGAYEGKVMMEYFNINHYSSEAQRIGREIFAHLLDCIGMGSEPLVQHTDIENKTLKIDVDLVEHYKNFGEKQNKIRKYYPLTQVDQNLIKDFVPDKKDESHYSDIPF
jgi:hypothetical protein